MKPLGILLKSGNAVNHRSLRKVLINPILRVFGIELASIFDENKFIKYSFHKCGCNSFNIFKNYYNSFFTCNDYDMVIKEHLI